MMARVFVAVGSNEGDRLEHVSEAVKRLVQIQGNRLVQMAPVVETAPVGGPPQGPYLNTVVELTTPLEPTALLQQLKAIERELGRTPSAERWGPRPIDLDLLFYDDHVVAEADCVVPHPRLHERRFVLEPLAQIAPDLVHPVLRQSIRELLSSLPSQPQRE